MVKNSSVTNRLETAFWEGARERERKENLWLARHSVFKRNFIYLCLFFICFYVFSEKGIKIAFLRSCHPLFYCNVNGYLCFDKVPTFSSWALEHVSLFSSEDIVYMSHYLTNEQRNTLDLSWWDLLPVTCLVSFGYQCLLASSCWISNPATQLKAIHSDAAIWKSACWKGTPAVLRISGKTRSSHQQLLVLIHLIRLESAVMDCIHHFI